MSPAAPRFRRIKLKDIRSIREPLELDLTAPLTVLMAPNGTGKTSICYGAEWLMTGQAGQAGDKALNVHDLRPLVGGEPWVEAEIVLGDQVWRVERKGTALRYGRLGEKMEKGKVDDLLHLMAHGGQGEDASRQQTLVTRMRKSRFLYSTDLAVLIDSDSRSLVRRQEVFADIFGVGHLSKAEKEAQYYLSNTKSAFEEAAKKLDDLEKKLRAMDAVLAADDALDKIERDLGAALVLLRHSPDGPLETRLVLTRAEWVRQQTEHQIAGQSLAQVEALWATARGWADADAADAAKQQSLQKEIADHQQQLAKLDSAIKAGLVQMDQTKLVRAMCDDLNHELGRAWAGLAAGAKGRTFQKIELAGLYALDWDDDRRLRRLEVLGKLKADWPVYAANRERLKSQRTKLADMPAPLTQEEVDDLEASILRAKEWEAKSGGEFTKAAGPLDALRDAGRRVLDALQSEHRCPLCSADWKNPGSLHNAIASALADTPQPLLNLQEQWTKARSLHEALSRELMAARENARNAAAVQAEISRLERELGGYEAQSRDAGAEGIDALEREMDALSLAGHASKLLTTLNRAQSLAGMLIPDDTEASMAVALAASTLNELASQKAGEFSACEAAIQVAQAERTQAMQEMANVQLRFEELAASRGMRRVQGEAFERLWKSLSENPVSLEELERLRHRQSETAASLSQVQGLLTAAEGGKQAMDGQTGRVQLEAQVVEARRKVDRLRTRRTLVEGMRDRLQEHRKTYVGEQLGLLHPVVQSFFLRAHANRFLDRLEIGEGEELLRWSAAAEWGADRAAQFDPEKNLSDGQRQDLALAVFLARACSLGGTFFLDEPLAHLDDLNRVAVLDILRMLVLTRSELNLVLTTANRPLVRHLQEKFARLNINGQPPLLRVVELDGNPLVGVRQTG